MVLGKAIEFEVVSDSGIETRRACVKKVEFTTIGVVYTALTPFGNEVRLIKREIKRFL